MKIEREKKLGHFSTIFTESAEKERDGRDIYGPIPTIDTYDSQQ